MYLSADRLAFVNQEVRETFSQTCISWQAIPHWDIGDPGATRARSDVVYPSTLATVSAGTVGTGPLGKPSLRITSKEVRFFVTLAQACAPTPDAMLAAVTARTAELAAKVDDLVFPELRKNVKLPFEVLSGTASQDLLDELIDARVRLENTGFRAPSCLFTNKQGLKKLSYLDSGCSVLPAVLEAASINSLYRIKTFAETAAAAAEAEIEEYKEPENIAAPPEDEPDDDPASKVQMVVLGRRQLIAQGGAPSASPGEEPVDLAVSVFPSLDVVGETAKGNIELAVSIQFALRVKDVRGLIAIDESAGNDDDDNDDE